MLVQEPFHGPGIVTNYSLVNRDGGQTITFVEVTQGIKRYVKPLGDLLTGEKILGLVFGQIGLPDGDRHVRDGLHRVFWIMLGQHIHTQARIA